MSETDEIQRQFEELDKKNEKKWKEDSKKIQEKIDETNKKDNIRLLIRLPQSGKTRIMLDEISDFIEEKKNPLVIVICDNSKLLVTQTYKRGKNQKSVNIGTISSNASGYCNWPSLYDADKPKKQDMKKRASIEKRIRNEEINTIVMCSNSARWEDTEELIDMFKSTHNISIWIDEADKTIGGVESNKTNKKIEEIKKWSHMIVSINLITATPFAPKYNWKQVSWIGKHFNNNMELIKVPEVVGNNYHHLYNSDFHEYKKEPGDTPCEYARKYLDNNPALPGDIFLIPGETKQESHEDIKNMCLYNSRFDYVIILNGKTKSIECEIGIYSKDLKQEVKTKEVSEWLSEWYSDPEINGMNKKIAIAGNLCISRGITISSNTCRITHMIFGSSSANIREEEQLLSRVCGYCYDANIKPKVICGKDVWERVSKYQKVVIKLTEKAMSDNRNLTTEEFETIMQDINNKEIDINKYRIYKDEDIVRKVCDILSYDYRQTKENAQGFKETSLNAKKCVASLREAVSKVPTAYGTNNGVITWRIYLPCYVDITDNTSLRFVVIIRHLAQPSPVTDENKLKECENKLKECDEKYPSISY